LVAGEAEVVPEMEREPGGAHGPDASAEAVDGAGIAPDVGVVVGDGAAGFVVSLRGEVAGGLSVVEEIEERGVEVGEVGPVGEPVVHLGVDVDGVFGAPGRVDGLVPDALKVGGEGSGTAARDEHVTAKLEVDGRRARSSPPSLMCWTRRPAGMAALGSELPLGPREISARRKGVANVLVGEGGGDDGRVEVELEAVVFNLRVRRETHGGEVEVEVAEGLIARHALRDGEHVCLRELFRFRDLAGEEEFADAGDGLGGFGVVAVEAGLAVPDGLLIELDALKRRVAEDHGAEAAVADREGVRPLGGGLGEVEQVRSLGVVYLRGEATTGGEGGCQCGGVGEEAAAGKARGHVGLQRS
jgi:hypothetical protein